MKKLLVAATLTAGALTGLMLSDFHKVGASSHREAPLISSDPLADNTDLYAFRCPDDPSKVAIVADYIPLELPEGGPNWTTFGEGIHYEIHIKNQTSLGTLGSAHDDITYRFTFKQENEDPTTFFNIRLGKQNLKTTYTCDKSTDGGKNFTTIITNGIVPPNNIGPRSINSGAGMNKEYKQLVTEAIATASSGETVFCGPRDDPFFVDLGGIFDLGQTRNKYGTDPNNSDNARDAVAGFNTHSIIMKIPIASLQKDGKASSENMFDPDFVIGVWASASRPQVTTLSDKGEKPTYSGNWVQVSRVGMPLTNEAIIPIGQKDHWNAVTPYSTDEQGFTDYFANPELALYMDDSQFGSAVPGLAPLRVQSMSYPAIGTIPTYSTPGFDFRNGHDGVFAVTKLPAPPDLTGTAFAVPVQPGLVAAGKPRLVDIMPIFYFGVPNAIPYQLATGKTGGPLSAGKPFIHNFLPITQVPDGANVKLYGGDMLRLNMATPVTPRNGTYMKGARMGLIAAAAAGLTDPQFNGTINPQALPHMDGFPNGRRPEDDVTTIALQAVGGLVLAAVGLPFDDATQGNYSDLASPKLVAELSYNAGPTANDVPLSYDFPYLADPHRGYDYVKKLTTDAPASGTTGVDGEGGIGLAAPPGIILDQNTPNPVGQITEIRYHTTVSGNVRLAVYDMKGSQVAVLVDKRQSAGNYSTTWNASNTKSGAYIYRLEIGGEVVSKKAVVVK